MKKNKMLSLLPALSICLTLMMSMMVSASAYVAGDINAEATTEVVVEADSTPLTPDGNGNLVDDSTSSNKEFITIQTKNGNYFYLILDKDRDSDNAYMLSLIDEGDLEEFIEQDESEEEEEPVITMPVVEEPEEEETEPEEEKTTSTSSNGMVTLLLLAAAGGAGYYFKVYKPKHEKPQQPDNLEGVEFEDDPEINEDNLTDDDTEE
jgi:hypothetical protein